MTNIAIENGPLEIVSFPTKSGGSFQFAMDCYSKNVQPANITSLPPCPWTSPESPFLKICLKIGVSWFHPLGLSNHFFPIKWHIVGQCWANIKFQTPRIMGLIPYFCPLDPIIASLQILSTINPQPNALKNPIRKKNTSSHVVFNVSLEFPTIFPPFSQEITQKSPFSVPPSASGPRARSRHRNKGHPRWPRLPMRKAWRDGYRIYLP